MRQVAQQDKTYELRADQRFTPRRLQALLRGRAGNIQPYGRSRLQAADQGAAQDGTPAEALGRRPGLADLGVLARVPHALPPRHQLGAARVQRLPRHPAGGRYSDQEPGLQAAGEEGLAAGRPRDRVHRRGCRGDARGTPEKKQKAYYSGKKKRHTLKSQVVVNGRTRQVICTHHGRGPVHDFALYQRSNLEPHRSLEILADSGYQGLQKLHGKGRTPRKKPRKSELTDEQKQANRELARRRVVVEHVIRTLKIFRILAERYRNRRKRFSLRFNLIAGLYNYELSLG